ncbi:site-2 protease family protein [Patescibacteria group bacterium]|nr:site-2 protease family protein [Patescibacteria group bacterium]
MLDLLFQNPIIFVLVAGALIVSISIHEFSHAFTAYKLGDSTPKKLGRVTLNPKAHLDPLGIIFLMFTGFGWGRPVPFNPFNLKNIKRDSAIISFAGPLSNFLLAIVLSFVIKLTGGVTTLFGGFLYLTILYNLMLGFFNLIPAHPLDGFKVVHGLLPNNLAIQWQQMQPFGVYILLFLIVTGSTGNLIAPLVGRTMNLLGL